MTTNNLKAPIATAIICKNHCASFGFSIDHLIDFMEFLTIDSSFDLLVNKYQNHIEFIINIAKPDNEIQKTYLIHIFLIIIREISLVSYDSLTNSYVIGKEYDCLTAKCMLHAVNQ